MPDKATVLDPDASETLSDEERRTRCDACDRGLLGHDIRKPADLLAELATLSPDELTADIRGDATLDFAPDEVVAAVRALMP